ncbi:hypothetical protein CAPTEDRAFT_190217, partial [Capitella teleta]
TTDVQEAGYRPPKRQKSLLDDFQCLCVEADVHADFNSDPNCHPLTSTPTHSIDAIATCTTPASVVQSGYYSKQFGGEKLQRYVVDDLAKSVQAMLGVVMTNTLALTITWTGNSHGATIYNRVKKNRFLDLESLIQTLLDALIATRFKKAALCDVRNATQNWLSNSPDRIDPTTGTGGKKERMERTRKRKEQMFSEDAIEHDSSNSVLE